MIKSLSFDMLRLTPQLCLGLCVGLVVSCGKAKESSESKPETTSGSPANTVAISGQLAIAGTSLLEGPKSLLLYQFSRGTVLGLPRAVEVDADGNFKAEISKKDEELEYLVEQVALPPAERNYEKMLPTIKSLLGDRAGDLTVEQLKNMPEEMIQDGIADLAGVVKDAGNMTVLVAYTKSPNGDLKAEASSFRFIGMPTAGNRSLNGFPNSSFRGDVRLGEITADNKDAKSELKADEALDLAADTIENLADVSKMLKIVKNAYMNRNWTVRPFYFWQGSTNSSGNSYSNVIDQWSNVDAVAYRGYGFYVPSVGDQGLTQADICGGKEIKLIPPASISLVDQVGNPPRTVNEFSNAGSTVASGQDTCSGGQDFYGRTDVRDGQTSFMLNFGTGGSIQNSPEGLWIMRVGGVERGSYDLASAQPVDSNGKPLVFVPRVKFNKQNDKIASVDVEFYKWSGTSYVKVTDSQLLKSIFSSVSVTVGNDNDKANSARTDLTIGENGNLSTTFDGTVKEEDGTVMNQAVPVSAIGSNGFAISYEIGEVSYRTEFR